MRNFYMSGLHRSAELLQGQNFVVYGKKLVYLRLEVLLGFGFHDSVGYCSAKAGVGSSQMKSRAIRTIQVERDPNSVCKHISRRLFRFLPMRRHDSTKHKQPKSMHRNGNYGKATSNTSTRNKWPRLRKHPSRERQQMYSVIE